MSNKNLWIVTGHESWTPRPQWPSVAAWKAWRVKTSWSGISRTSGKCERCEERTIFHESGVDNRTNAMIIQSSTIILVIIWSIENNLGVLSCLECEVRREVVLPTSCNVGGTLRIYLHGHHIKKVRSLSVLLYTAQIFILSSPCSHNRRYPHQCRVEF